MALRRRAWRQAEEDFRPSLTLQEKAVGPTHPYESWLLAGLAESLLAQGQPAAALPLLERALANLEPLRGEPGDRGIVRFALARALWALGPDRNRNRVRALEEARKALEDFGASRSTRYQARSAEASAWIRTSRLPAKDPRVK